MAKDEIAKQLEELKRYIKEQERQEKLNKKQQEQQEPLSYDNAYGSETDDYYDDDFDTPQAKPVPLPLQRQNTPSQTERNVNSRLKKQGCGCITFIITFLLVLSFALPFILHTVKRINYNKSANVKSSAAVPAPNKAVSSYDEENIMNMIAVYTQQEKAIEAELDKYRSSEHMYRQYLSDEAKEKSLGSAKEKEKYFTIYYGDMMFGRKKYIESEYEAVEFFLDYSRLELSLERTSEEINRLKNMIYTEKFAEE